MTLALTLFLAGADSAPSLLPRGFSIIFPKLFDTGFGTFWFFSASWANILASFQQGRY